MHPSSQELLVFTEFDPQQHILEAQEATREDLRPFVERVESIKELVGVELREAARIRTETQLPDGLVVELQSGDLQMSPDTAAMRDTPSVLTLSEQQRVREDAEHIGVGRNRDITLSDLGMSRKKTQINIEGGRIFSKLRAEIDLALEEGEGPLVVTLSNDRELDGTDREKTRENLALRDAEAVAILTDHDLLAREFSKRGETVFTHADTLYCLGTELSGIAEPDRRPRRSDTERDQTAQPNYRQKVHNVLEVLDVDYQGLRTEYDGGVVEIMSHPEFIVNSEPTVVGYIDVHGDPSIERPADDVSGSLIEIGAIRGRAIYIQRVPQELKFEDGKPVLKTDGSQDFSQPNAGEILFGTSVLLDSDEAVVATSNTYFPSRVAQVMLDATYRNALDVHGPDKRFGVISYSPERMAKVQRTDPSAVVLSIAHLLGEIKMADIALQKVEAKFREDLDLAS